MNKKIIFLSFFIILLNTNIFFISTPNKVFATSPVYAKIETSGVFLYNSPINEETFKAFEIPATYFVELLADALDEKGLFYSARYIDVFGYVKKSEVTAVEGTPTTPFATNTSFRIFSPSGLDLKSSPSNETPFNRIVNVPYLCTDLVFYGQITGDEMIPGKSTTWYYCKYLCGTSVYYGYLYSDLCDKLSTIPQNAEILPKFEGELFAPVLEPEAPSSSLSALNIEVKLLVIIAICLPCLALIYLIFKPTKLVADNGTEKTKKIKRLKKSEFYELED